MSGAMLPEYESINRRLIVQEAFGEEWLNGRIYSVVQKLWRTNSLTGYYEIALLGEAIQRLKIANNNWLISIIKKIKDKDNNNARGALFELLSISLFVDKNKKIEPAPENQPGYDAIIEFSMGKKNFFIT